MADLIVPRRGNRFKDITGQRFGRLVAIEPSSSDGRGWRWRFACDCGGEKICRASNVSSGHITSCGCLRKEAGSTRGNGNVTHGMTRSSEYGIWASMKTRCYNPKAINFADYGGRGITVCDRWRDSFEAFHKDMGPRPSARHTMERIDNDLGYEPKNCRWASYREQGQNRRSSRLLTYNGETLTASEWSRKTGIGTSTIDMRLSKGWPVERVLTKPPRKGSTGH
jgi:hypothetical protein